MTRNQTNTTHSLGSSSPFTAHALAATQYAHDVVDGTILACKWVRHACQRHLDDLTRSEDASYPYRYDHDAAGRICYFVEQLPHVDGEWGSPTIVLEPWQKFVLGSIYGWLKKSDGRRRFTTSYVEVPRKNTKSTMAAGVCLYGTVLDKEQGAQVYCAATTLRQAKYVFDPAKRMAETNSKLFSKLGLQVNAQSLVVPKTNARFVPICSNPGDGGGASTFVCDEYHEHDDNILYDAITRGMGARRQPLTFVITTAGSNIAGPCYELERQIKALLEGTITRERTFGIIYTVDEDIPWDSIEATKMANPNWGVSVIEDTYMTELEEALQDAAKQNSFKTKRLNVWCNAAVGFFNMEAWRKCEDPAMDIDHFAGKECVTGLDLASKLDLCATMKVFRREIDGEDHYYLFPRSYLPDAQTGKPENTHYLGWVKRHHLTATYGDTTDYQLILDDLLDDAGRYKVRELCFDQREATFLTQVLGSRTDTELVEIPQNVSMMSEPLKWLQSLIVSGRIHHTGCPVLTWCVSNVIAREDAYENVYPRKAKNELKIDLVTALLNALCRVRAVLGQESANSSFEPFFLS